MNEWISVKDKMPGDMEIVIAWTGIVVTASNTRGRLLSPHAKTEDMTHWMPMPNPPEGERWN